MTNRRAKRMLNEADDWLLFTSKTKDDEYHASAFYNRAQAWEILLNLAVSDHYVRETLRNILHEADKYLADQQDSPEP